MGTLKSQGYQSKQDAPLMGKIVGFLLFVHGFAILHSLLITFLFKNTQIYTQSSLMSDLVWITLVYHEEPIKLPILSLTASGVMTTDTDPEESTEQEAEWKKSHHVYARQFCYPGSTVKRFPVPEEKVPWEVPELNFTYMRISLSIVFICPYYLLRACICAWVCTCSYYQNVCYR